MRTGYFRTTSSLGSSGQDDFAYRRGPGTSHGHVASPAALGADSDGGSKCATQDSTGMVRSLSFQHSSQVLCSRPQRVSGRGSFYAQPRSWRTVCISGGGVQSCFVRAYRQIGSQTAARSEPDRNVFKAKLLKGLEARAGIEPAHKGFADLSLTTWVPRLGRAAL